MSKLLRVLGSPYKETLPTGNVTLPFVPTFELFNSGSDGDIWKNWYLEIMHLENNVKSRDFC